MVDGAFAATYVLMISVFNMGGRFFWASASDRLGRKRTYWIFFALGSVLYLSIPLAARQVSVGPSVVWPVYFYAASMLIFTMYGGGFATIPAYLADVFGSRYVGAIHGRLLTAGAWRECWGRWQSPRCASGPRLTPSAIWRTRLAPRRFKPVRGGH